MVVRVREKQDAVARESVARVLAIRSGGYPAAWLATAAKGVGLRVVEQMDIQNVVPFSLPVIDVVDKQLGAQNLEVRFWRDVDPPPIVTVVVEVEATSAVSA